jgi:hypothetical protein
MVSTLVAYAIMELGMSYAVATFAVNFALSLIITRVFAENPEQQQDMGVRQQVPPSAVNAIPIVYGNAYMGGTFVDAVLTTDQKTMYYVLAISSISPNGQFTFDTADMYYGDRKITFDGSDLTKVVSLTDEAGNVDTKISGYLYINLYTSTTGGTITSANGASAPSTVMGVSDIAVGQRWTGTRQMNGLGFAIVKLIYNRDADTTQLQPITFKVAHTLNGTGVAKAGDVWYDYMTNAVYGGAVDAAFVNSTSATALNAYGDQNITFTNSSGAPSTQPRYRINGVLDAGQSVLSNVDRIVSACDSWMTYNAALGQWSVVINKAESTAYAFNDNNIIGEIRVSATDITSSINQIEARFPFKENRDQAAFVNIETPSGLLYPNEPVNKYSITYDLVNDSVQAHYLANRLLEQAREDLIVSFSTTYYGIQVDAGDVVSVTNIDYGWNAKLFRVMKVNEASLPDGSLGASLEMSEYNAQVYDDQDITQFTPIPNSGLASVSYFSPLAAPTVTGFPSATIPYINIQVFVPTTGRVTFANLFWTTSATPTAADWKLVSSASTTNGQPVTNNSYYTFANITLNTGTYYFAYMVGNDVTSSVLSPISAALVWNPVAGAGPTGPTGATGTTGLNSATIYLYNKNTSTTPPALFSGTFTYTFATGVLSGGTLNGWSQTPPSVTAGEFLFLSLATASSTSATDSIPYTEFSTPEVISGTGTNGANTAIVSLFNKNTSAVTPPTTFSGTFTYTFATAALSGGTLNGWTQSIPSLSAGEYLWQRQATAFSINATDTIAATEFSSAVTTGAFGPTGASITGETGNSSRICYSKTTLSSLSPTPTTITTSGSASYPPNDSWGAGTVWGATAPAIVAGESVYQSDGIYSPVTNNTVWNVPYLSNLKVGQLSAISANLGTITTGQITNNSYNTIMQLGAAAGGASSGATMYFERTGSASLAVGPIIYGNDISTSKTSYSYAFISNVADTFIVYSAGLGIGSYNGVFQTANGSGQCFVNLSVQGYTEGPQLSVSQNQYNGTGGSPVNPAGDFVALDASLNQAARIKLASGTGYAYYIVAGVGGPFTGAHDALISKTETIVQGDILVDVNLVRKSTLSDTIFTVTKSTTPNQCALGVFNSGTEMFELAPPTALVEGYRTQVNPLGDNDYIPIPAPQFYVYEPTHNQAIVNSIGEGQINVCGENGNIAVGDLIVTSSTAGKGMKQADDLIRSYTVAKAREAATFSSLTDVQMIACIYVSG